MCTPIPTLSQTVPLLPKRYPEILKSPHPTLPLLLLSHFPCCLVLGLSHCRWEKFSTTGKLVFPQSGGYIASACPSRQPQSSRHGPELFPMGSKSHQTPVTGYRHGCFLEVRARLPPIHAASLEPRCGVFSVILLTDLHQFVANFPHELVSREAEPCLCPLECHLSWPDNAHASGLLVMGDASWQIGWRLLETQTCPVKKLPTQFSPRAAGARIGGMGT